MASPACSEEDFIRLVTALGTNAAAREIGVTPRRVNERKARLRDRGVSFEVDGPDRRYPQRYEFEVRDGIVLIGSDFHIWPGKESTALRAFKKAVKWFQPDAVILNGDVMDFPKISRHAPIMWENAPDPQDEIEAAQDHLHQIAEAAGHAHKVWTLGNHDARFESRLASIAPEYRKVAGVHLQDHFPLWEPCWSSWINDDVVVKHRPLGGGIGAARNSTLKAGKTMVCGHLHSMKVVPYTDYNGTRYGVDTGCIADPSHKAFVDYTEDGPLDWRSGFCVLTFKDGRLLMPELVQVWNSDSVEFRGRVYRV